MAPEMLRNEGYDFLADVWSIGVAAMFGAEASLVYWHARSSGSTCRLWMGLAGSVAYLLVYGSFPYSPSEAAFDWNVKNCLSG